MSRAQVSLSTKILYGIGEVGISLKNASINRYLLYFYADVMRLDPRLVGLALFIGKFWDAATDPAMGYWSDTTRSRWGRRRPFILLSALPMGILYYLLFSPPAWEGAPLFAYLLIVNISLFSFFTVYAVPYLAMGAELVEDYHERTRVVQLRALFGLFGGVAGAVWQHATSREGFSEHALLLGSIIAISGLVTGFTVHDPVRAGVPDASFGHFMEGLRGTFRNRDFRVTFGTFCLITVAAALGESIQLIVVKYWLGLNDEFPTIVLTFGLSFACSFPLWLVLSHRLGKHRALMAGLAAASIVPFGWLIVQPGQLGPMLVFMVIAGAVAGCIPLAMSLAIDVVDIDEWHSGEQRAGAYFGIWAFGLKAMGALGTLLGGFLLSGLGFKGGQPQEANTIWWLVMIVGPLQSAVTLAGFLVLRTLKLEQSDVEAVQKAIRDRREEKREE